MWPVRRVAVVGCDPRGRGGAGELTREKRRAEVAVLRVVLQLPSCSHFWTTLNDPLPCVGQPWNPPGIRFI